MHVLFEYLPLIVFFVVYKLVDIYWATASLIVLSVVHIGYFLITKQPVPKRNLIFFVLIAVFGGLTIYMHDDTFLKWKVSIINGFFALALLIARYGFNQNIIQQLMGHSLTLPTKIWDKLNASWAVFFIFCAILNWYIAFHYSQEIWVNFKVFGLTFIFAIGCVFSLSKYVKDESSTTAE